LLFENEITLDKKAYFDDITVKTFIRVLPTRQDDGESQLALKLRHCHPIK